MVTLGYLTSTRITGWPGPLLVTPDWAAVMVVLPLQNDLLMRVGVYAPPQPHVTRLAELHAAVLGHPSQPQTADEAHHHR